MIRRTLAFPLIATLALGACGDSSPTATEPQLDDAAFELAAETTLEANDQKGNPLPSLDNLLRRTYRAIRESDGHGQGVRLLKAGYTLRGIVAVLGPEVVPEALAGVNQALSRLDSRFAGKILPDRSRRILDQAKVLQDKAHSALAGENYPSALGAALASADLIRSLSPRYQARKAIERASRAFDAARGAVGDGPTEEEKATLKKALRFRNGAIAAFGNKEYRKAWTLARKSLAYSQRVLKGRSDG